MATPTTPSPQPPHRAPEAAQAIVVTVMGSHPGWPDGIGEFGRVNMPARAARRIVFEQGIAGAAKRGVWDRVPQDMRVDGLTHDLLWLPAPTEERQAGVVGRLWQSRDTGGRIGPMLAIVASDAIGADWLAEQAPPRLIAVEKMCRETKSAELVRLSVGEATHQLEDTLAMLVGSPRGGESDAAVLASLARAAWPTPEGAGPVPREEQLARVMTAIENGAEHVRVPRVLDGVRALRAWGTLVRGLVKDRRAVLVASRDGSSYIDVFVGGPDPLVLSALRASEKHTPLVTRGDGSPPSAESVSAAESRLRDLEKGAKAQTASSPGPANPRKAIALLSSGALLVIAVVLYLVFSRDKKDPGATLPKMGPLVQEHSEAAPGADHTGQQPNPALGDSQTIRDDVTATLNSVSARIEVLRRETADQQQVPDASLAARASALHKRLSDGESPEAVEKDVDVLARDVDASMSVAAGSVLAFLRERSAQPPASVPAPLHESWSRAVMHINPRDGLKPATARVASIARELHDANEAAVREYIFDIPDDAPIDVRAMRVAQQSRLDIALRRAGSSIASGDASSVSAADDDGWGAHARVAVEASIQIGAALSEGKLLSEQQGGREVREWSRRLREAATQPDIGAAVSTIDQRVRDVERIEVMKDPAELLAALRASADGSGKRISEVRTAWSRLADSGWPRTAAELTDLADTYREVVTPAVSVMQDSDRRSAVTSSTEATARSMWASCAAEHVASAEDLRAAEAVMDTLGVGPEQLHTLPERMQFSIARDRLARSLESGDASNGAKAFVAESSHWASLEASEPGVKAVRAAAEQVASGVSAPSLATLGPGGSGWTPQADKGGRVVYTAPDGTKMEFAPLQKSSERVTYLCTTEVSVAMAAQAVADPAWHDQLVGVLPDYRLDASDPRMGPRTWGWTQAKRKIAPPADNASGGWVRVNSRAGGEAGAVYAEGVAAGRVTAEAPMQYVSPLGAAGIAAALGCRLPTVSDWAEASKGVGTSGANLRDTQFAKQAAWIRDRGAALGIGPVASDIFIPFNSQRISAADDTQLSVSTDDGVLWFSGVEAAVRSDDFLHLTGNVAEFVLDDASPLDGLESAKVPTRAMLESAVVRVVGGSALSPASYPTDEPQALDMAKADSGFSDVGFRLAFTAPAGARVTTPEQELRDALAAQPAILPTR